MKTPQTPAYDQHLMYPYEDADGILAGVTIPIIQPFESLNQWQALMDGLITGLKTQNPNEDLEGVYTISFENTPNPKEANSLNIHRLSKGEVANTITENLKTGYPDGILGLLAIIKEPDHNLITGTLALQGTYTPSTQKMHADRVLAGVYDMTRGSKLDLTLDAENKRIIRLLGKMMLKTLDTNINNKL